MSKLLDQDDDLPLEGVRVLDLSRVIAGPMCAQVLGDFGAEVVKVEHPGRGDDTRDMGLRIGETETTYFNSFNRNKKSITLDLQSTDGVSLLKQLLPNFDVVIHNFKSGGAEKLGIGYEDLKAIKPDIIYCAVSGYGAEGPEAQRPGYDLAIQGEAGLMAINGEAQRPPLKFGVAVVDFITGLYAAQAVIAALLARYKKGKGRRIDIALYDCGLTLHCYYAMDALLTGKDPERFGNAHPSIVPYGLFETADEPLIIAVGNNAQFEKFCTRVIDRPDILQDPRYATNADRITHRLTLLPLIMSILKEWRHEPLLQRMQEFGIPCGKMLSVTQALQSERTRQREMIRTFDHPSGVQAHVFSPPYRFNGQQLPVRFFPPSLGSSTQAVLQQYLNISDENLQTLQERHVLTLPQDRTQR